MAKDTQQATNPATGQLVVQQPNPDTGKVDTLPVSAPCPWWCAVTAHKTGLWEHHNPYGTDQRCRRSIGNAECTAPSTEAPLDFIEVHIERYQCLSENGVVEVFDPAVSTDNGWSRENQLSVDQAVGLIRLLGAAAGILDLARTETELPAGAQPAKPRSQPPHNQPTKEYDMTTSAYEASLPPILPPITCKPWCASKDGHPRERSAEGQLCHTDTVEIPLSYRQVADQQAEDGRNVVELACHDGAGAPNVELGLNGNAGMYLSLEEARTLHAALGELLALVQPRWFYATDQAFYAAALPAS